MYIHTYIHVYIHTYIRDLGVTLDQELTFAPRIHRLCRDSCYQFASAPHCYLLSYLRVYRYTYPCLHYSSTRLLQLTLCWPPSWAVTVPRQCPAHCRTPLWAHPQIWPRFHGICWMCSTGSPSNRGFRTV